MFGAATEGRRVPQNDIELGSFLRKCFPKSESHQMLQWRNNSASQNAIAQATAISKSQAVIEFNMDGTIVTANQNFLDTLGYRLEEIRGKHHSMFVAPNLRDSAEYRSFWANLNRGEYQSAEYKRLGKGGKEVWIQASYNPIFDRNGKPCKVIKFATDITARKIRSMEDAGKMAAIGRSQAVIEFDLDGTIITANDIFQKVLGYSLAEIQGKHHSMFVSAAERDSSAYREFWASLNRGQFQSAEYKRLGKGGKEVWILASYNPILDDTGKPFRVVKFASDITEQKLKTANFAGQIEAIGKSQAVIEFGMDGTVLDANENFLKTLGYSKSKASITACSCRRKIAREMPIARSGRASTAANFRRQNTGASARAVERSGSRPPTIRSAI
jgi:methyl-accepting chemotaxis protein